LYGRVEFPNPVANFWSRLDSGLTRLLPTPASHLVVLVLEAAAVEADAVVGGERLVARLQIALGHVRVGPLDVLVHLLQVRVVAVRLVDGHGQLEDGRQVVVALGQPQHVRRAAQALQQLRLRVLHLAEVGLTAVQSLLLHRLPNALTQISTLAQSHCQLASFF